MFSIRNLLKKIAKFFSRKIVIIISSSILVLSISLVTFITLKPRIYEIYMDKELFEMAKKNGVFTDFLTLKKYPEGSSYEIKKIKKAHIEIVSSDLRKSPKIYRKAIKLGKISYLTKNTPFENNYEGIHGIELKREQLFPCIPFIENSPKCVNINNLNCLSLFTLNQIPQKYIALYIEENNQIFYANDKNYPLWKVYFADFSMINLSENQKKENKWDKLSYEYAENQMLKEVFYEKMKNKNPPELPPVTFIAAVGDMMLGRGVQDAMITSKKAETVFTDTMPILKNNDFTIGNLECVVTSRNVKTEKTYNFKVSKNSLKYLKEAGFDYLMMTNNHCYDYGEDGFKDTLKAVKEAGFATSGAGYNKKEASDFYRTTINNQDYSILSLGAYPVESKGFNGKKMATATETRAGILWESDDVINLVKKEKEKGAVVIINVHAGSEYVKKPNNTQKTLYKKLCDAGADVIFGSHPHVLQPVEVYNGSLIVWSLGNYIFPGMDEMPGGTDTMIVRTGFIDNKLVYYEKYPAKIVDKKVVLK